MGNEWLKKFVRRAMEEDLAWSDVTTELLVDEDLTGQAFIVAKENGVISGQVCAKTAFELMDEKVEYVVLVDDGFETSEGSEIARIRGRLRAILSAERTALNFLQHLSGVATLTRVFSEKLRDKGIRVLDTRKTTPGLRALEKEAVVHGGGVNHRMNLGEMILVKENHIEAAGGLKAVVEKLGARVKEAEIEVRSIDELMMLSANPPKRVMLDNFSPGDVRKAVEVVDSWCCSKPEIEVSGGITLENVDRYAVRGVDFISIGSITSSARALDLSLLLKEIHRG